MFLEQIANVIASLDGRHQLNSVSDPQPAAGVCTTSMTSAHSNSNTRPSLSSPPLLANANDTLASVEILWRAIASCQFSRAWQVDAVSQCWSATRLDTS